MRASAEMVLQGIDKFDSNDGKGIYFDKEGTMYSRIEVSQRLAKRFRENRTKWNEFISKGQQNPPLPLANVDCSDAYVYAKVFAAESVQKVLAEILQMHDVEAKKNPMADFYL